MDVMTAKKSPHRSRHAPLLVGLTALLAVSCGPSASSIAGDACDLARDIMAGNVGVISAASQANSIMRDARDADISFNEVLDAARDECPDLVGHLPF